MARNGIPAWLVFAGRCLRAGATGDWRYYAWIGALGAVTILGLNAYANQAVAGLATTGLQDQVPWGIYIANFTFLLGIAGAAVILVIPVSMYIKRNLQDLVIFCALLAVTAIVMALAFVVVDLGRPDRFAHIFPGWVPSLRVIVLAGYLLLNLHIVVYLLYCHYRNRRPSAAFYIPFVLIAVVWAITLHTATAFLFLGLGETIFWNQAIIGPRFITAAFVAGPALLLLALQVTQWVASYDLRERALPFLRMIMLVAMVFSVFLLLNEVLRNYFRSTGQPFEIDYLYFGLNGFRPLIPWIVTAVGLNLIALIILVLPAHRSRALINVACICAVVGIWIEKAMGLVVPGFIPTPLGEIMVYTPTWNEAFIWFGIWAFGLLIFTFSLRVTIPILQGTLSIADSTPGEAGIAAPRPHFT